MSNEIPSVEDNIKNSSSSGKRRKGPNTHKQKNIQPGVDSNNDPLSNSPSLNSNEIGFPPNSPHEDVKGFSPSASLNSFLLPLLIIISLLGLRVL